MGKIIISIDLPDDICKDYELYSESQKENINYSIKKTFLNKYFSDKETILLDIKPKKKLKEEEIFIELMDSYISLRGHPIRKVEFFNDFVENGMKFEYKEYLDFLEDMKTKNLIFQPDNDHIEKVGK